MLRSCFKVIIRSTGAPSTIHARQSPNLMLRCLNARPYGSAGHLSRDQIEERVLTVLRNFDRVNQSKIALDANLTCDLGLDSLDVVEVMIAMEEQFATEIPDAEADRIKTPKEVVDYFYSKLGGSGEESNHH